MVTVYAFSILFNTYRLFIYLIFNYITKHKIWDRSNDKYIHIILVSLASGG